MLLTSFNNQASQYAQTYPYELNPAQSEAIIEQAVSQGIPRNTVIEKVKSFALTPSGHGAQIDILFEADLITSQFKKQQQLVCKQTSNEQASWSCKKYTTHSIKLKPSSDSWIKVNNPHEQTLLELTEVLTYADKIKPVSWDGELSYLNAEFSHRYWVCFGPYQLMSNPPCLTINRTMENDQNYFNVNWSELAK